MTEEEIYSDWRSIGVDFVVTEHEPVFTVAESARLNHIAPGRHTKNLFLKDKRGGHWLIVLPAERRADLKAVALAIGADRLSFASPESMLRLLKVTPGSVTPLSALNAASSDVVVVFDSSFDGSGQIAVHPLRNTATVTLNFEELSRWMSRRGRAPRMADLS